MNPNESYIRLVSSNGIANLPLKDRMNISDLTHDLRYMFRMAETYSRRLALQTSGSQSKWFRALRDRYVIINDELESLIDASGKINPHNHSRIMSALSIARQLIKHHRREVGEINERIVSSLNSLRVTV